MAKINFSFSGWVVEADVTKVTETATGNEIDVSGVNEREVARRLNEGEWTIALGDHLYENRKNEIEIFDFVAEGDE